MSAIVGIVRLDDEPVRQKSLAAMLDALAHRGPDGVGMWTRNSVGLGHRMLWTTTESLAEKLPRVADDGRTVLTADARIDNREELLAQLGMGGRAPEQISDSEIILEAWRRWGERCPAHLIGDFAFAIWDGESGRLFCARDVLGIRCIYYHPGGRIFTFATEIKGLLALREVPRQLDDVRVGDFLAGVFDDQEITFYRGIQRLPAGHSLIVNGDGRTSLERYWSFDADREIRMRSDDEYAEAFREKFTEAVSCRMRSAYSVGSTLSGGIDSSSIACTARDLLRKAAGEPLHTFSAIFPDLPDADLRRIDERHYMDAVLAEGGLLPHYVRADLLGPLVDVERVLWHEDEAILAPNLYIHWGLYGAAREVGVRIFLDGLDGDTTVSHGLEHLADLAWTLRWRAMVREARALARRSPSASYTPWKVLRNYAFEPLIPTSARRAWRKLRRRRSPPWSPHTVISTEFARRIGLAERVRALRGDPPARPRGSRASHLQGFVSPLLPYAMELSDKAVAAFGLEARYPFFDRRLMEFCLALPGDQKLRDGWTRFVLRRAMQGVLPVEVQWRNSKANLAPNLRHGFGPEARERVRRRIERDGEILGEFVDLGALQALFGRYTSANELDIFVLYGAVTLGLWLRECGFAGSAAPIASANKEQE